MTTTTTTNVPSEQQQQQQQYYSHYNNNINVDEMGTTTSITAALLLSNSTTSSNNLNNTKQHRSTTIIDNDDIDNDDIDIDDVVHVDGTSIDEVECRQERCNDKDSIITRLDINVSLFQNMKNEYEKQHYIDTFVTKYTMNPTIYHITSIHISLGQLITSKNVLSIVQIQTLLQSIQYITTIQEYYCFYSNNSNNSSNSNTKNNDDDDNNVIITDIIFANSLPPNLKVLILWYFPITIIGTKHCTSILQQKCSNTLQRFTIHFHCCCPKQQTKYQLHWSSVDTIILACISMKALQTIQIRCIPSSSSVSSSATSTSTTIVRQMESIISVEAFIALLNCTVAPIQQIYLENCGLLDDHIDEIYNELAIIKSSSSSLQQQQQQQLSVKSMKQVKSNNNTTINKLSYLTVLDLKDNLFTDDTIYTIGRFCSVAPEQIQYIDISGVSPITNHALQSLSHGIVHTNYSLQSIEIDGTVQKYYNEFDIPIYEYSNNIYWYQYIQQYQLRINRAYTMAATTIITPTTISTTKDTTTPVFISVQKKREIVSKNRYAFVVAVSTVSDNIGCMYYFLRNYSHHFNSVVE